ncbi:MAG: hypothetical protein ABUS56_04725 [Acidobacteriota bacterium]
MTTDLFRRYGNLLRADGTNQLQRLLPALEADYIVPDERSLSDLVEYARSVAAEIRYYDLSGQSTGDWRPFVELLLDPATPGKMLPSPQLEAALDLRADWPPHLVLFLAFLKLFQNLQGDLNQLTERHLRHYYEQELGLQRRAAVIDDVHVIFELARNGPPTLLRAGTLLDAGKDEKGRSLTYATQTEVVVSAATVKAIRRWEMETDQRLQRRFFVAEGFTELEGAGGFTFGRRQLDLDPTQRFMTEAPLGFGVAAPILRLAEGERRITLLAHLQVPPPLAPPVISQGIGYALDVTLTGAEGWLVADTVQADLLANGGSGRPAISLTVTLGVAAAAVVDFDGTLHGPGTSIEAPVLRCLVKGDTGIYDVLDGLVVERVELSVNVKGVRNLVVQNADGPLNASQAMPLFGAQPQIGAPFYVGSAEVFSKRLTSLDLHLEWKGVPADLIDHYLAYFDHLSGVLILEFHTYFQVDVALLYDRSFRPLAVGELFAQVSTNPKTITVTAGNFDTAFAGSQYLEQPALEQPDAFTPGSKYGFLRLVLVSPTRIVLAPYATTVPFEAFGHSAFPRRYATQAIALSQSPPPNPKPLLPNEPYTPVLNTLSLDYTATSALIPGDHQATGTFLNVGPFGATPAGDRAVARLVPEIDGEAALFLGIERIEPPANLSMFFQIEEGTADSAMVLKPGDTEWSYLAAGDSWRPLSSSGVLIDSTEGFQRPGLISIAVPRDASLAHDSLPSDMVWLRGLIRHPPDSAARTLAVKTHAALARFQPGTVPLEELEQHLISGLAAGTIARLVQPNANIRRVEQPNPSFGGRATEGGTEYFRRSSERLRHRNRAVTAWDLERLVLQAFPEVFKVKCLPHTDAKGLVKAGHAALVIVPNVRRTGATNVLEPRAGTVLMGRIQEHVAALATPFATVHVIHPVFERIRVEAGVVFTTGRDPGYYAGILNDDLRRFLSPWAYQEGEDILFGARIYRSEILAFVEGREYVDHLTGLNLYHSFDGPARGGIGSMTIGVDFIVRPNPRPGIADMIVGDDFVVGRGVEVAETTQEHAILVSHPEHLITPVAPGTEDCPGVTRFGIGYMTVGLDFTVHSEVIP